MANISSYLAAIMAAVYGEDVRGSIHDAIDIINKVGEVVLNTGTAVTGPTSPSTGFYDGSFYINTNTMELWKCIGLNSWQSQGVLKGADGADGNGIISIVKTATVGLVDTYTITFDDGTTTTYDITNGSNGSKWYKGTAISGTGTSITGFPGLMNDFYLNSVDGYVYICTKSGGSLPPDAAEWDYVMTLTGGGGTSVTVIDNLTSTSTTDALSANQGRALKGMVDGKVSDNPTFTQASSRTNIASGESLATLFGKIMKWFADLKDLAFIAIDGGSSTKFLRGDGTWQTVDTPNDGQLNVFHNGASAYFSGGFSANTANAATVNIETDEWTVAQIISTSDTSKTFTGLNTAYAYKPYIQVADGEDQLPYKTLVFSGTSCTITFDSPTAAQAAGNACQIKLRIIK